jgi:N-acetylmuramoyl-L-alanine amidase
MTRRTPRSGLLLLTAAALLVPLLPGVAAAQEASPQPTETAQASSHPTPTPTPTEPSPEPTATAPAPAPAGVLRLSASTTEVVAGRPVSFSVVATDGNGAPLVAEEVDLLSRQGGTTTVLAIGRVVTDGSGTATLSWTPRVSAEYTLRRVGGATATSERRIVHVTPTLNGAMGPASVGFGGSGTLRGTLTPAYAGARLQVQRRFPDGSWRGVAVVGTGSTGAYAWTVRPAMVGRYVFRAVLPATMAHRAAASAPVALAVAQLPAAGLRQGATGAAVTALEQRLVAVKADVGRIDGVFDADLRHAVTAFQKSQGLPRTGVYDATTRARLASPLPVRLRYPAAGRAVEVDIAKQVLYLSQGGVLQRIVDVSTGNDQLYTVDGITSRAVTPRGRFRIERKIDGIRISRLGELYRPAYFHRGWAIHGSPSVPTYPASHGCVRVTNAAQNRLFPLLTVGTPVAVY